MASAAARRVKLTCIIQTSSFFSDLAWQKTACIEVQWRRRIILFVMSDLVLWESTVPLSSPFFFYEKIGFTERACHELLIERFNSSMRE